MTMNRVIHAAVRRDLDRLEAALRVFSDGDRPRAAELRAAWKHLDDRLTEHHRQEDDLIWPALLRLGVDRGLLEEMEQEHEQMAEALRATDAAMTRLGETASAASGRDAAASVVSTREVVERHLRHEEGELEPALAPHSKTPEWLAVERELRRGSPFAAGRMFAWLLDGAGPDVDRFVRATMPRPMLFVLTRLLGFGYHRSIAPVWRR